MDLLSKFIKECCEDCVAEGHICEDKRKCYNEWLNENFNFSYKKDSNIERFPKIVVNKSFKQQRENDELERVYSYLKERAGLGESIIKVRSWLSVDMLDELNINYNRLTDDIFEFYLE